MRKLKRMIARNRMEKSGVRRTNKKSAGRSYFAKHWREYL